jgi:hypothetical protein
MEKDDDDDDDVTGYFRKFPEICCTFYFSLNNPVSITERSKTFPVFMLQATSIFAQINGL